MPEFRIIIAEDSPTQALQLRNVLEQVGYEVILANDGQEAFELLQQGLPDLVISDVMMPKMDGFELCKKIKSNKQYQSIPIILLTSLDNIKDVIKGLSVGADNYFSKSFNYSNLLFQVDQILNKKHIVSETANTSELAVQFEKEQILIDPSPSRILDYFITSYKALTSVNEELQKTKNEISELNSSLENKVNQRTQELQIEADSHKNTFSELKKALKKSQKLDLLKTEFLQNLSHEVRTPMNAILGFSQLLGESDIQKDDSLEYIPYIKKSMDQLLVIISDMMEASEIVSGNVELEKSDCNLKSSFDNLKEKFSSKIESEQKDLNITYTLANTLEESKVTIYAEKVIAVLDKLLSNAVKFTEAGSIEFGVEISNNNNLEFYVQDSGIGIDKDYLDEVFDYFKQLESSHAKKYQGTGLGLSITKRLIDFMGGEIWIESTPNKGTKINFSVPYFDELIVEKIAEVDAEKPSLDLDNLTILLAEDSDTNHKLVHAITKRRNINLIWAKNGLEAISMYEEFKEDISLILMDIQMPKMDGVEATRIIKEKYPETIIIALSAYISDHQIKSYKKAGFNTLIQKPVNPSRLFEIIKNELIFNSQNKNL